MRRLTRVLCMLWLCAACAACAAPTPPAEASTAARCAALSQSPLQPPAHAREDRRNGRMDRLLCAIATAWTDDDEDREHAAPVP
jgi:hypothetical protein